MGSMEFNNNSMELNNESLDEVSAGRILETKEGKWLVVPENTLIFDTEAEAKASEQTVKHMLGEFAKKHHGHHHGHGPFGPGRGVPPTGGSPDSKQQ